MLLFLPFLSGVTQESKLYPKNGQGSSFKLFYDLLFGVEFVAKPFVFKGVYVLAKFYPIFTSEISFLLLFFSLFSLFTPKDLNLSSADG